jgi:hypothetical protein
LTRCVESVLAQSFDDFELLMCDDASGEENVIKLLRHCQATDGRVRLILSERRGGISSATNLALYRASGRFVVFLDHDDELADDALRTIAQAIEANSEADVLYSDSDKITPEGRRFAPALKPAWSPDLLCSTMYIEHVLVVRRTLVNEVGGLRSEYDGSQDHDLALRVTENARSVIHIPRILYHWRASDGSSAANPVAKPWAREPGRAAVADALVRRGELATISQDRTFAGRYHCVRRVAQGTSATIALLARDSYERGGIPRVRHSLGARASELAATAGMSISRVDVSRLNGEPWLDWTSNAIAALRAADTEVVILLDPRLVPLSRRWASALVSLVARPGIGAVGGCVTEGSRLVHAGLVVGLRDSVGPVLSGLPAGRPGYQSMAIVTREVSALDAQCIAVKREAVAILEKLPRTLSADLAAAALCLIMQRNGDRTLYTPVARFRRRQRRKGAASELLCETASWKGVDWFQSEFAAELAKGDPFYNPGLSLDDPYCRLGPPLVNLPLTR